MSLPSASTQPAVSAQSGSEVGTRLSGRWLVLARLGWVALVIFILGVFGVSLPGYIAQLQVVSGSGVYVPWQLSSQSVSTLEHLGFSLGVYSACVITLIVTSTAVYLAIGGVLFWRKSDDWMALFVALMLVLLGTAGSGVMVGWNPGGWEGQFVVRFLNFLISIGTALFFCLFPDGRFVPHWSCWLIVVWILLESIQTFFSTSPFNWDNWPFPLSALVLFGLLGCLGGSQIYRYRRLSNPVQRQQTKWVVFALVVTFMGIAGDIVVFDVIPQLSPALSPPDLLSQVIGAFAWNIVPVVVPLAIGIAILRYRLWDIDIIINRTLVYGTLTISIVALYVLVVVGFGALLQAQGNLGIALLATGLVAVVFHPLGSRLQRAVNRLMYGDRDDPYRVLTRLGQRLEATLAPEAVLPTIVETVAQALKLPYAAIALKQDGEFVMMASSGTAPSEVIRLPLVYQSEPVGELRLSPRAPGESFTPADRVLLEDLARQAGIAAHAVRLTADLKRLTVDLQRSREYLVTAREEERRRLRRDLHDGLGPQLASLTLKLETARNRMVHDPLAQTLLSDLAERTQATVADIRRLVYALRPPALDELGLLSALRELTLQYSDQVIIHLEAPGCLPELPAAVEVAIYRIAQEALTNVVRHAAARHCDMQLTLDESAGLLTIAIQDDGCGLPPSRPVGVGMSSMRERAEELGGTWTIEPMPMGGTRVLAWLPSARAETGDEVVVTPTVVSQEEE
jgi:signal transduction histidine kinase